MSKTIGFIVGMWLICLMLLFGCSNGKPNVETIKVTKYLDNMGGKNKFVYYVLKSDSSIRHGEYRLYGVNNELLDYEVYKYGLLDSEYIYYWPNGLIRQRGSVSSGNYDGNHYYYHKNGKIYQIFLFESDRLMNVIDMRDSTGKKLDYGSFKDGNGILKLYFSDGHLFQEGKYVNGLREGEWTTYFLDGNKWVDNYKNGSYLETYGDSVRIR